MSTFSKEFNAGKHVVIPSIQREYVQPLNESVINGFVDALVKAYSTDNKKDLNYIYGLESDARLVPVDGQQRLTTLWLMHLYVAARKGQELSAVLEYKTRDFSSDFSVKLRENAVTVLATSNHPSKDIKDANWFIETWARNITVSSMLHALDVIHQSIAATDVDIDILWHNMTKDDSPVTFAFMSTKDLGDDVYVKLNARGKALSDFENLKSWLDDRLTEIVKDERNELDEVFLHDWRLRIDNDWTDLFWRNRNLNDLFPEEIDDEQLRLFYNIAFILWAQNSKAERKNIIRNSSDIKSIAALLKVEEDKVVDRIMERMRESVVELPLYILDKLNIFNEQFFTFAKQVLNGLIRYEDEINNDIQALDEEDLSDRIYFWDLPKVERRISFMCQLLMSEKDSAVSYPKLVIGGALCYYVQNENNQTSLRDWLRFIRNIANNTKIEADNVHNILSFIKNRALSCASQKIDEVIASVGDETAGIDSTQLNEEKDKAFLSKRADVIHAIHRLENHRFFFGRVGFLLKLLNITKPEDYDTTLINYAGILYKFFGADGPNFDSNADEYLAHRVLLACSNYHGIGYEYKKSWCLFESKSEWKYIYLEDEGFKLDSKGDPYNIGIIRLLNEAGTVNNLTSDNLKDILDRYKEKVDDWRRPFIDHWGLWDYMASNCLRFFGNYNVLLIPGVILQSGGRRSELRARSLFLDLKDGNCLKAQCPPTNGQEYKPFGWTLRFWDYGENRNDKNSYLYFEKEYNGETSVIDVYFEVEFASNNRTESSYCIELYVRENERENKDLIILNEEVWGRVVTSILNHKAIRDNTQGRYLYSHLSKQEVIALLTSCILVN